MGAADVMAAVGEMLRAAGLSLDSDRGGLMERVMDLQAKLAATEAKAGQLERDASAAQEEAESKRQSWSCRICLQSEVDAVMVACGHCLCSQCSGSVRGRCPFCRTPSSVMRLYN